MLRPGQMEAQVVKIVAKQLQVDHAHKLTLGGKTDMQAYKCTKKIHFKATSLGLPGQNVTNVEWSTYIDLHLVAKSLGEKLALTFEQIWSGLMSKGNTRQHSTCKSWPNGVPNRSKFWTCIYLRLHLARP